MKVIFIISITFCLLIMIGPATSQNAGSYQGDTTRVMKLIETAQRYRFFKPDSSVAHALEALKLSQRAGFRKGEVGALLNLGEYHRVSGNYPEALGNLFQALQIGKETGDSSFIAEASGFIGIVYINLKEYQTALQYLFYAYSQKDRLEVPMTGFILANAGIAYRELNMLDSALNFQKMAWSVARNTQMAPGKAFILRETGNVYSLMDQPDSALYYYRYALAVTTDVLNIGRTYSRMAILFYKLGKSDSVLNYANNALLYGRGSYQKPIMLEASKTLASYYIENNKLDSALKYQQLTMNINDSLFGSEQIRKVQLLAIDEQKRVYLAEQKQQEIEQEQKDYQSNLRFYGLMAMVAVLLLFGSFFYRSNKRQKMANVLLQKQKKETEDTLTNLRATQVQLIQSEKMASLGELTAGIAHEIQNPLNFVNNFSEVNKELAIELQEEIDKGNYSDAKAIAKDIRDNEEKIIHHGKRADAIVKGMLQHSRGSSGQKEPTDINALCDEYLRLAYHGLKAKDPSFNASFHFDADETLPKVNVVPQDIGRVLLNLINNAFQACGNDEFRMRNAELMPHVKVSTKNQGDKIEISVKDNGPGIPDAIKDKIFQPFFTTKPTGQGTGLGLSLSYDIVKAHGGELKVETTEGEESIFVIELPKNI